MYYMCYASKNGEQELSFRRNTYAAALRVKRRLVELGWTARLGVEA